MELIKPPPRLRMASAVALGGLAALAPEAVAQLLAAEADAQAYLGAVGGVRRLLADVAEAQRRAGDALAALGRVLLRRDSFPEPLVVGRRGALVRC